MLYLAEISTFARLIKARVEAAGSKDPLRASGRKSPEATRPPMLLVPQAANRKRVRAIPRWGYLRVNAPPASLPLLVNGRNGGLSACRKDAPGTAPAGTLKVKLVSSTMVSGICALPTAVRPPRLSTPLFWVLKKIDYGEG